MNREGWIAERRGEDRRERWLRLAKAGRDQFKRAFPRWEKVQAQIERRLGAKRWHDLHQLANEVTTVLTREGDLS